MNNEEHTTMPFDNLIETNEADKGKYISLVDLQEFIFNTCNVEDNTIFIDFPNYLQFLARQRELNHHPTITDEDIMQLAHKLFDEHKISSTLSFKKGAKAVLSMMPQSEGWVKVEDVPTDRVLEVLLFNANQAPHLQHIIKGTWFLESKSFKHSQLSFYEPSHWMPLPKHP